MKLTLRLGEKFFNGNHLWGPLSHEIIRIIYGTYIKTYVNIVTTYEVVWNFNPKSYTTPKQPPQISSTKTFIFPFPFYSYRVCMNMKKNIFLRFLHVSLIWNSNKAFVAFFYALKIHSLISCYSSSFLLHLLVFFFVSETKEACHSSISHQTNIFARKFLFSFFWIFIFYFGNLWSEYEVASQEIQQY